MTRYTTALWSLELADGWVGEHQDDCHSLSHPEGFGTLSLSAFEHSGPADDELLQHLAAEHLEAGAPSEPVRCGPFRGFALSYGADDGFWSEWYLRAGRVVLFVSYTCAPEHEALDDEVIEGMLGSLRCEAG